LNFWREFFFQGSPRLIVPFGDFTALAISANFLSANVTWPGVPPERAKQYKNAVVEENLFDLAALQQIDDEVDDFDLPEEEFDEE
jgi:hypothetical protein